MTFRGKSPFLYHGVRSNPDRQHQAWGAETHSRQTDSTRPGKQRHTADRQTAPGLGSRDTRRR